MSVASENHADEAREKMMDDLTAKVTADIEGQNWTDRPLSEDEKHLIWMAVRATMSIGPSVFGSTR